MRSSFLPLRCPDLNRSSQVVTRRTQRSGWPNSAVRVWPISLVNKRQENYRCRFRFSSNNCKALTSFNYSGKDIQSDRTLPGLTRENAITVSRKWMIRVTLDRNAGNDWSCPLWNFKRLMQDVWRFPFCTINTLFTTLWLPRTELQGWSGDDNRLT